MRQLLMFLAGLSLMLPAKSQTTIELSSGSVTIYEFEEFVEVANIYSIISDHAGNIWIATEEGIFKLKDDKLTHFTTEDGLGDNDITVVYQSKNKTIWSAGDNSQGLNYFEAGTWKNIALGSQTPRRINDIQEGKDGVMYMTGLHQNGYEDVFTYSEGSLNPLWLDWEGYEDIEMDDDGNLLIAYYPGWLEYNYEEWKSGGWPGYFSVSGIYLVEVDSSRTVWASTLGNGVWKYTRDESSQYDYQSTYGGLLDDGCSSITGFVSGELLAGTNYGISMWKGNEWSDFKELNDVIEDNGTNGSNSLTLWIQNMHKTGDRDVWIWTRGSQKLYKYTHNIYPTGVDKVASRELNINVAPNPVVDYAQVSMSSRIDDLKIFDVNGVVVISAKPMKSAHVMDLTLLSAGVYVVVARSNQSVSTQRILKN